MSQSVLFYQSFIGVDLHKTTVTLVAVAPDGTMIARLTINTKCREKIAAWLLALPRAPRTAGSSKPTNMLMMTMTVSTSTNVKPCRGRRKLDFR